VTAQPVFPPYPWQRAQWQRLQQARASGRIGHAWLLAGPAGLGKSAFAGALAHSLLCDRPGPTGEPCLRCRACHLVAVGTHPDLEWIGPEEPGKPIKVDAIRAYCERSSLTAQIGYHKVAILEPADAMNSAAANSLLKTLEEPSPSTILLLVTAAAHRLPATVRSRCQRVDLPLPDPVEALSWLRGQVGDADAALALRLAVGAPLAALAYADATLLAERSSRLREFVAVAQGRDDPVRVAQAWLASNWGRLLDWLVGWLLDLLRLRAGAAEPAQLANPDQAQVFQRLAGQVDSKVLFAVVDQVLEARRATGSNLNHQLALEGLLIRWAARTPNQSPPLQ
jgi:DNA polymerase III subunit delta'